MADDLLLFSLPCFCRGAAPIGAVVIRKVTEARPPSGSTRSLILSGRGVTATATATTEREGEHEIRKNRARSGRNCGNYIIATPFRAPTCLSGFAIQGPGGERDTRRGAGFERAL